MGYSVFVTFKDIYPTPGTEQQGILIWSNRIMSLFWRTLGGSQRYHNNKAATEGIKGNGAHRDAVTMQLWPGGWPANRSLSVLMVKWGNAFPLKPALPIGLPILISAWQLHFLNPEVFFLLDPPFDEKERGLLSLSSSSWWWNQSSVLWIFPSDVSQTQLFLHPYCHHIVQNANVALWNS